MGESMSIFVSLLIRLALTLRPLHGLRLEVFCLFRDIPTCFEGSCLLLVVEKGAKGVIALVFLLTADFTSLRVWVKVRIGTNRLTTSMRCSTICPSSNMSSCCLFSFVGSVGFARPVRLCPLRFALFALSLIGSCTWSRLCSFRLRCWMFCLILMQLCFSFDHIVHNFPDFMIKFHILSTFRAIFWS